MADPEVAGNEPSAAFAESRESLTLQLSRILDAAAAAHLLSVGHRSGALDALSRVAPARADEVAAAAGLQERYVRELLAGLAAAHVVEYDSATGRFALRPGGADVLGAGSPGVIQMQYLTLFAEVEDALVACMRDGGGIDESAYRRHRDIQLDAARAGVGEKAARALAGIDGLDALSRRGIDWLDVGCGAGVLLLRLAERYPGSRFVGYEAAEELVEFARSRARRLGLGNIRFECGLAETLPLTGSYDVVTMMDLVHDHPRPLELLRWAREATGGGGRLVIGELPASRRLEENLAHPTAPFVYLASLAHCVPLALANGGPAYGPFLAAEDLVALTAEAGFRRVSQVHAHEIRRVLYVCD